MASGVEELMDLLYQMIDEAKKMPLSGDKCIIERNKALDLLDEIRGQFPMELSEAKKLIASRNDYLASAKREAELIKRQAEERARVLGSESEIVKSAQQRAAEIMAQAQAESRTLRQTTADYCDNMLKTTEETMIANASQVKNVRASLRQQPKKQQP